MDPEQPLGPVDANIDPANLSPENLENAGMTPQDIAAIFDFTPGQEQKYEQLNQDEGTQELSDDETAIESEDEAVAALDDYSKLEYAVVNKRHVMITYQKATRAGMPTMPAETYIAEPMPPFPGFHNKSGTGGFLWANVIQREGSGALGIKSLFLSQIISVQVLNTAFV